MLSGTFKEYPKWYSSSPLVGFNFRLSIALNSLSISLFHIHPSIYPEKGKKKENAKREGKRKQKEITI